MRRVILPSIRPGVLAGAIFAFIASWDEIVVTLFLSKEDRKRYGEELMRFSVSALNLHSGLFPRLP